MAVGMDNKEEKILTELQGYEYFTDDVGATKAIQVSTGEITGTVLMCLPIGSQIRTPEVITAQTEYLKLKEQNELRRLANNDLGKFFYFKRGGFQRFISANCYKIDIPKYIYSFWRQQVNDNGTHTDEKKRFSQNSRCVKSCDNKVLASSQSEIYTRTR